MPTGYLYSPYSALLNQSLTLKHQTLDEFIKLEAKDIDLADEITNQN